MYADFLNDRCDIYHLQEVDDSPGYGLQTTQRLVHSDAPDLTDVPCHFNRAGAWEGLIESVPLRTYPGATKVQFPLGTDVRTNDKIVDRETGIEYTASVPRVVGRNHHIAVRVNRLAMQERL